MTRQISKVYLLPTLYISGRVAILIHTRHVNGQAVKAPTEGPYTVPRTHQTQLNHVMCGADIRDLDTRVCPNAVRRSDYGAAVTVHGRLVTNKHDKR
jgi:hypothetical protein